LRGKSGGKRWLEEDGGDLDSLCRWDVKGGTEHKRKKHLTSCKRGKKIFFSGFCSGSYYIRKRRAALLLTGWWGAGGLQREKGHLST